MHERFFASHVRFRTIFVPFPLGSGHHERWYDATLGRIGFGQGTPPPPVVESLTATFTTASTAPIGKQASQASPEQTS